MGKYTPNTALQQLRKSHNLSQKELAHEINYGRALVATVECGREKGTLPFWEAIQDYFNIPDDQMWGLIHNRKEIKLNEMDND